jgi:E3 ubiquitin-protein ligase UBR3
MASNSLAAHVLMKKGKRGAAAYVHAGCSNSASPQHLSELLDLLLNPEKTIDEWDTIDWCKWLIAGGRTPDEFSSIGKLLFMNSYTYHVSLHAEEICKYNVEL